MVRGAGGLADCEQLARAATTTALATAATPRKAGFSFSPPLGSVRLADRVDDGFVRRRHGALRIIEVDHLDERLGEARHVGEPIRLRIQAGRLNGHVFICPQQLSGNGSKAMAKGPLPTSIVSRVASPVIDDNDVGIEAGDESSARSCHGRR